MASYSFINRLSPIRVHHLSRFQSGHAAISISLEVEPCQNKGSWNRPHLFHFKEVGSKDPRCEKFVEQLWNDPNTSSLNKFEELKSLDTNWGDIEGAQMN